MPGSVTSVFSEAADFEAALRPEGCVRLLVTGRGSFRARLTQITLDRLRLASTEEELARVAYIAVPDGTVLVAWPTGENPPPHWGGISIRAGDILTLGPRQRVHATSDGACRWSLMRVPDRDLVRDGRALCGASFPAPPALAVWRITPAAARRLAQLHRAAIRVVEARSGALANLEAAHGLEQQLIDVLIESLCNGAPREETAAGRRHRELLAGFEDLLWTDRFPSMAELCAALDTSGRLLRACCRQHLRMGPSQYLRLRRMQQVYRTLRKENPAEARVSEIAEQYGIRDLGRFASEYRTLYGELPSATLRRSSRAGDRDLALGRPRVKFL